MYILDMNIIFQDESVIVVDKPTGIETETFVRHFQIQTDRGGLVHRLDKGTSGILSIAKTQSVLEDLQQQFREHAIKKIYTALVYGQMATKQGNIEAEIARDPKRKQAMKVIAFATGRERGRLREAMTGWQVLEEYHLSPLSLLKLTIQTGRTHQIRVHLQYIGHPVLGDPMYNTKESQKISKLLGLNRQFLHATELGFKHPATGKWVEFISQLPDDLQETLDKLT